MYVYYKRKYFMMNNITVVTFPISCVFVSVGWCVYICRECLHVDCYALFVVNECYAGVCRSVSSVVNLSWFCWCYWWNQLTLVLGTHFIDRERWGKAETLSLNCYILLPLGKIMHPRLWKYKIIIIEYFYFVYTTNLSLIFTYLRFKWFDCLTALS